jgi:predicted acetyltransferase
MSAAAIPDLRLRPLGPADEPEAMRAHTELGDDGFVFLLGWNSTLAWDEYLASLEVARRAPVAGFVPAILLAATVGARIVGRTSIRLQLNDALRAHGGHIGYAVRPADRRRGYATEILRQSLIIARAEGIEHILVTCDEDNPASARAIQANGGVLQEVCPVPGVGRVCRYWID